MIGPIELAELGAAALLIFGLKVPEYAPGPRWARGRTLAASAAVGLGKIGYAVLEVLAGTRGERNVCARCGHTRFQHGPRGGPCCGPECAAANAGYMRGGESGCAKFLANAAEVVAESARGGDDLGYLDDEVRRRIDRPSMQVRAIGGSRVEGLEVRGGTMRLGHVVAGEGGAVSVQVSRDGTAVQVVEFQKPRSWLAPCAGCGDLESEHPKWWSSSGSPISTDERCTGPACRKRGVAGSCVAYRRLGD